MPSRELPPRRARRRRTLSDRVAGAGQKTGLSGSRFLGLAALGLFLRLALVSGRSLLSLGLLGLRFRRFGGLLIVFLFGRDCGRFHQLPEGHVNRIAGPRSHFHHPPITAAPPLHPPPS